MCRLHNGFHFHAIGNSAGDDKIMSRSLFEASLLLCIHNKRFLVFQPTVPNLFYFLVFAFIMYSGSYLRTRRGKIAHKDYIWAKIDC